MHEGAVATASEEKRCSCVGPRAVVYRSGWSFFCEADGGRKPARLLSVTAALCLWDGGILGFSSLLYCMSLGAEGPDGDVESR